MLPPDLPDLLSNKEEPLLPPPSPTHLVSYTIPCSKHYSTITRKQVRFDLELKKQETVYFKELTPMSMLSVSTTTLSAPTLHTPPMPSPSPWSPPPVHLRHSGLALACQRGAVNITQRRLIPKLSKTRSYDHNYGRTGRCPPCCTAGGAANGRSPVSAPPH